MLALLLVLLLVALLFGLGFAVKWLFILAAIVAVIWLVGLFARAPRGTLVPLVGETRLGAQAARAALSA